MAYDPWRGSLGTLGAEWLRPSSSSSASSAGLVGTIILNIIIANAASARHALGELSAQHAHGHGQHGGDVVDAGSRKGASGDGGTAYGLGPGGLGGALAPVVVERFGSRSSCGATGGGHQHPARNNGSHGQPALHDTAK